MPPPAVNPAEVSPKPEEEVVVVGVTPTVPSDEILEVLVNRGPETCRKDGPASANVFIFQILWLYCINSGNCQRFAAACVKV